MSDAYQRFLASLKIGYIEWHDGIGYDLEALRQLGGEELANVENTLVAQCRQDWREVEALDVIGSERALAALRSALESERYEVRIAAAECLERRGLFDEREIETLLLEIIPTATILNGLTFTLNFAECHATPAVRQVLLWCCLYGHKDIRVHAAARIEYIYGKAASSFDWVQRRLYLRFNAKDLAEREPAYRELCKRIGVDPQWGKAFDPPQHTTTD